MLCGLTAGLLTGHSRYHHCYHSLRGNMALTAEVGVRAVYMQSTHCKAKTASQTCRNPIVQWETELLGKTVTAAEIVVLTATHHVEQGHRR